MPTPSLRAALGARLARYSIQLDVDRLDQHLLVDRDIIQTLVSAARLTARTRVVDLGAGTGTITEAVAPHVHRVVAVEIDTRFAPILDEVRSRHPNVDVLWGDFLQGWPPCDRIVANPPWSTLEALAARLATRPAVAASLVVSRQFASAATAVAEDEAFGRATIYVQSTFRVESVADVRPDAFLPAPRRPAEILVLHRHERPPRHGDRHRLAVALATRGDLRVRDLAARLGRPPTSLPGRNQQRLQHLDREALAALWAALDPAGEERRRRSNPRRAAPGPVRDPGTAMSDAEQALAARLTAASEQPMASASPGELRAIRRYQGLDRTYQLVNSVLRGEVTPERLTASQAEDVRAIVAGLTGLLGRWHTPEPLRVYRGMRNRAGFPPDAPIVLRGFLSTTIHRHIALEEFTVPTGAGGAALLEIDVPAGAPAVWVSPLGDPDLAYQGELLLPRDLGLVVRSEHEDAGILVYDCEVQL